RWFWQHPGINPLSICRALIQNIKNNRIVSGGSTITMQVSRLISPHTRSITGKIKQIFIAFQLEWHYSKEQILTYYINHAPFGGTIEGVQAASYTYLDKSAQELSHAEAALLTILPQAPSRNRPDRHPNRALLARNKVLHRLATQSVWTEPVVTQALLEPIIAQHNLHPIIAPLLARRLKSQFPEQTVIKTTIDYDMQIGIEALVKQYIEQLPEKTSAAVLVVENKFLKVKTYVGSANFLDQNRFGHVDMIQAIRSPGSTLKPFLYGIAIDRGLIHSESLLTDAPLLFDGYKPQNFSRGFTGPVSVSHALKRSLNIPAIQVLHNLTPEVFVSTLKNAGLILGFNSMAKSNLSVILGGVGSNLETLVGTYTALANGGHAGQIRFSSNSPVKQHYLFSAGSAWIIKKILSNQNIHSPNTLSWKTGTSYGHRDFWSI
ncbi:MAG: penicillin-binding protein 1C, partial [Thiotrichaceae bacterium]|nr:penicillin-binding protein 1C [Thiotrichaceae bacterium]